jgi:hypothetical protein
MLIGLSNFPNVIKYILSLRAKRSEAKQSQHLDFAIASFRFAAFAMATENMHCFGSYISIASFRFAAFAMATR